VPSLRAVGVVVTIVLSHTDGEMTFDSLVLSLIVVKCHRQLSLVIVIDGVVFSDYGINVLLSYRFFVMLLWTILRMMMIFPIIKYIRSVYSSGLMMSSIRVRMLLTVALYIYIYIYKSMIGCVGNINHSFVFFVVRRISTFFDIIVICVRLLIIVVVIVGHNLLAVPLVCFVSFFSLVYVLVVIVFRSSSSFLFFLVLFLFLIIVIESVCDVS